MVRNWKQARVNDRRNHDPLEGSQLSAVLSCLVSSLSSSLLSLSLSSFSVPLCLRVVCVGVLWRAVLLGVVVVCVGARCVCRGRTLPEISIRRAGVEQLYQVYRMIKGNRQHVVLDLLPNFKMVKIQCLLR